MKQCHQPTLRLFGARAQRETPLWAAAAIGRVRCCCCCCCCAGGSRARTGSGASSGAASLPAAQGQLDRMAPPRALIPGCQPQESHQPLQVAEPTPSHRRPAHGPSVGRVQPARHGSSLGGAALDHLCFVEYQSPPSQTEQWRDGAAHVVRCATATRVQDVDVAVAAAAIGTHSHLPARDFLGGLIGRVVELGAERLEGRQHEVTRAEVGGVLARQPTRPFPSLMQRLAQPTVLDNAQGAAVDMLSHLIVPLAEDGRGAHEQRGAARARLALALAARANEAAVLSRCLGLSGAAKARTACMHPPAAHVAADPAAIEVGRLPLADARQRVVRVHRRSLEAHELRGCLRVSSPRVGEQQREHLDRLSKAHLVRQDAATRADRQHGGRRRWRRQAHRAVGCIPVDRRAVVAVNTPPEHLAARRHGGRGEALAS